MDTVLLHLHPLNIRVEFFMDAILLLTTPNIRVDYFYRTVEIFFPTVEKFYRIGID